MNQMYVCVTIPKVLALVVHRCKYWRSSASFLCVQILTQQRVSRSRTPSPGEAKERSQREERERASRSPVMEALDSESDSISHRVRT